MVQEKEERFEERGQISSLKKTGNGKWEMRKRDYAIGGSNMACAKGRMQSQCWQQRKPVNRARATVGGAVGKWAARGAAQGPSRMAGRDPGVLAVRRLIYVPPIDWWILGAGAAG